ncbi:unnamed protein product [Fructobacillus fructosus]|uniref:Transmembrane protein n=1 Tax=Fructobacillus fructosus TaxID=1631 RepID=A0ABM9N0A2_9LACO|nr:unnamed protein product [Fructobacillus fructosus]CAK1228799.1 unnamed protein product [Fructobacillus fructosus]CAK1235967.1 unnamed protein product [Fructobacillus fructosus]CAK1245594.1 unnamed protein product [Fructobacillus fructosus]CAK1252277.1 unnamed protein product [Fructobacillus fructosus]
MSKIKLNQRSKYGSNQVQYQDNSQSTTYNYFNAHINTNINRSSPQSTSETVFQSFLILGCLLVPLFLNQFENILNVYKEYAVYQYLFVGLVGCISIFSVYKQSDSFNDRIFSTIQSIMPLILQYFLQRINIPTEYLSYFSGINISNLLSTPTSYQGPILFALIFTIVNILLFSSSLMSFYQIVFKHTLLRLNSFILYILISAFLIFGQNLYSVTAPIPFN